MIMFHLDCNKSSLHHETQSLHHYIHFILTYIVKYTYCMYWCSILMCIILQHPIIASWNTIIASPHPLHTYVHSEIYILYVLMFYSNVYHITTSHSGLLGVQSSEVLYLSRVEGRSEKLLTNWVSVPLRWELHLQLAVLFSLACMSWTDTCECEAVPQCKAFLMQTVTTRWSRQNYTFHLVHWLMHAL